MKIRVYYEDTDCGNVVYYANYLKFMERSRTEYLRERGIDLATLHKNGILFVVINVNITYRAPAVYDDLLEVHSEIIDFTSSTVTFTTTISNAQGKLLVKGDVRLACTNAAGRAGRIPKEIREKIFLNHDGF
ncbi:MAG: YbgC/FadM family acyl-CoA thioesterase [Chitinispirillaceae bacterium]|nr:YbgC/FadM family acyl-CoA thioesterase [Chitinispirillaceae bacterium]